MFPLVHRRCWCVAQIAALLLLSGGANAGLRAVAADAGKERGFPEGARAKVLADSLAGTKWLWYGKRDRVLEFRPDGTFELDDWANQGITAIWEATGPDWVTVTVTSDKFHNLTANLVFSKDRTYFTGTDLDWNRVITKSPRVSRR